MAIHSERDILRNKINNRVFKSKSDVTRVEELCDFYYNYGMISMIEFDELVSLAQYKYEKFLSIV